MCSAREDSPTLFPQTRMGHHVLPPSQQMFAICSLVTTLLGPRKDVKGLSGTLWECSGMTPSGPAWCTACGSRRTRTRGDHRLNRGPLTSRTWPTGGAGRQVGAMRSTSPFGFDRPAVAFRIPGPTGLPGLSGLMWHPARVPGLSGNSVIDTPKSSGRTPGPSAPWTALPTPSVQWPGSCVGSRGHPATGRASFPGDRRSRGGSGFNSAVTVDDGLSRRIPMHVPTRRSTTSRDTTLGR